MTRSEDKEFGYMTSDDDDVTLTLRSNSGRDKDFQLNHAKKLERPILIKLEGEVLLRNEFSGYALTLQEAILLGKELLRMAEHLEDN